MTLHTHTWHLAITAMAKRTKVFVYHYISLTHLYNV